MKGTDEFIIGHLGFIGSFCFTIVYDPWVLVSMIIGRNNLNCKEIHTNLCLNVKKQKSWTSTNQFLKNQQYIQQRSVSPSFHQPPPPPPIAASRAMKGRFFISAGI